MKNVDLFYDTGFDVINIPCSPELLYNEYGNQKISFTDVNLIQTDWLGYITLELESEQARNIDYAIVTDEDTDERTCYIVDHYEMIAEGTCKLYMLLDPYNTMGGFEEGSGNIVISGTANRMTVPLEHTVGPEYPQAEDNMFFTLEEPFQPSNRLITHYNSFNPAPPTPTTDWSYPRFDGVLCNYAETQVGWGMNFSGSTFISAEEYSYPDLYPQADDEDRTYGELVMYQMKVQGFSDNYPTIKTNMTLEDVLYDMKSDIEFVFSNVLMFLNHQVVSNTCKTILDRDLLAFYQLRRPERSIYEITIKPRKRVGNNLQLYIQSYAGLGEQYATPTPLDSKEIPSGLTIAEGDYCYDVKLQVGATRGGGRYYLNKYFIVNSSGQYVEYEGDWS